MKQHILNIPEVQEYLQKLLKSKVSEYICSDCAYILQTIMKQIIWYYLLIKKNEQNKLKIVVQTFNYSLNLFQVSFFFYVKDIIASFMSNKCQDKYKWIFLKVYHSALYEKILSIKNESQEKYI